MRPLTEITAEIKRLDRSSAENVWEIGKLLFEAKQNIPHGKYTEWVLNELKFSGSYAARLVLLYTDYSSGLPEGFAVSTLLCTLPLEEALRSQVLEVIRIAELTTQQAEALRSQAQKDSAEAAAKLARLKDAEPDPAQLDKVREEIRAELRAEYEAAKPAKKTKDNSAELEQLRADLQSMREGYELRMKQQAEEAKRLSEAAVAAQQVEARARAEAESLRAKLMSAEVKTKEVRVEVPPADYDELRQLAAQVPTLRSMVQALEARQVPAQSMSQTDLDYLVFKLYNCVHPDEVEFERKRDQRFSELLDSWIKSQPKTPNITVISSPGANSREARKRVSQ